MTRCDRKNILGERNHGSSSAFSRTGRPEDAVGEYAEVAAHIVVVLEEVYNEMEPRWWLTHVEKSFHVRILFR